MDEPRDCHTGLLINAEMSRERRRVEREVRIIIPRSIGPEFLTSFLDGRGHPASGPSKAVVYWTTGKANQWHRVSWAGPLWRTLILVKSPNAKYLWSLKSTSQLSYSYRIALNWVLLMFCFANTLRFFKIKQSIISKYTLSILLLIPHVCPSFPYRLMGNYFDFH